MNDIGKDFTNILRTKVVAVTLDPTPLRIKNLQDKANEAADYIDQLEEDNVKLQSLWVTVNLSCNPPDDCNDPKILKEYMRACTAKADEYEQPNGPKNQE